MKKYVFTTVMVLGFAANALASQCGTLVTSNENYLLKSSSISGARITFNLVPATAQADSELREFAEAGSPLVCVEGSQGIEGSSVIHVTSVVSATQQ